MQILCYVVWFNHSNFWFPFLDLKLFEDPDLGGMVRLGDSLLLPDACKNRDYVLNTGPEEDTEELLRYTSQICPVGWGWSEELFRPQKRWIWGQSLNTLNANCESILVLTSKRQDMCHGAWKSNTLKRKFGRPFEKDRVQDIILWLQGKAQGMLSTPCFLTWHFPFLEAIHRRWKLTSIMKSEKQSPETKGNSASVSWNQGLLAQEEWFSAGGSQTSVPTCRRNPVRSFKGLSLITLHIIFNLMERRAGAHSYRKE